MLTSNRAFLLILAVLALLLPLNALATEAAAPGGETVVAELVPEAPGCGPAPGALVGDVLDAAQPSHQGCFYRCTSQWECPEFPDTPPATCQNGCCNYDTSCGSTCSFDSDCGEMASCWSGCCYSWTH